MVNRLKRGLKRIIILLLILGGIAVIVITFTTFGGDKLFRNRGTTIIIDTDSGRNPDDLFALARALTSSELKVTGITSTHWSFHKGAGDSSLQVSQRLNEQLLELLGKSFIPHPEGAADKLWYDDKPSPNMSPAAEFIVHQARESGKKLNIVCLGALTNVASAIMTDTTIASKIRIYAMGPKYEPKKKIWNKNEFNARNDLDALDYLLNNRLVEMHIMPYTTAEKLEFSREEIANLQDDHRVIEFLLKRWRERFPEKDSLPLMDIALIEAIIDQDLVREEQALTPPENVQRPVKVYTSINKELMKASFKSALMKDLEEGDE